VSAMRAGIVVDSESPGSAILSEMAKANSPAMPRISFMLLNCATSLGLSIFIHVSDLDSLSYLS
jgi:hypothetical protein